MLETKVKVGDKYYKLLIKIINNTKCFDRRDNTVLLNNRQIANKLTISPSSVDQLFRELKKMGLVKMVRSVEDVVHLGVVSTAPLCRMLDPKFLFISYTKSDIFITVALWDLEDIVKVREWRGLCKRFNYHIDSATGEMTDFNWYYMERIANSYRFTDRCYRKGSKSPHTTTRPETLYNKSESDYYE